MIDTTNGELSALSCWRVCLHSEATLYESTLVSQRSTRPCHHSCPWMRSTGTRLCRLRHTCSHSSLLSALLLSAIFILSDLSLLHEQLTNHRHRERRELGGLCRSVGGLLTSSRLHSAQEHPLQLLRLLSRVVAETQEPPSIFRYFEY